MSAMRNVVRTARLVCPASLGLLLGALLSLVTFPAVQQSGCVLDEPLLHEHGVHHASESMQYYALHPKSPSEQAFEAIVVRSEASSVPLAASKSKLVRPKYFASEVGMRDKLFVVFLLDDAQSMADPLVVALNRTVSHHVSKLAFVHFVRPGENAPTAVDSVMRIPLRHDSMHIRHLALLEHLTIERVVDNYDWVYVTPASTYVRAVKLHELVSHLSIGSLTLMGKPDDRGNCMPQFGIIFSQELLQAFKAHRESCISEASRHVTSGENLAKCMTSLGALCTPDVGHKAYRAVHLRATELADYVTPTVASVSQDVFNTAIAVHPVLVAEHVHVLHRFYCTLDIEALGAMSVTMREELSAMASAASNSSVHDWPVDMGAPSRPRTRYEAHKTAMFTMTHLFDDRPDTLAVPLTGADRADVDDVLERARAYVAASSLPAASATFVELDAGYRLFDPTRGMDYTLDMRYTREGETLTQRVHVVRPLTRAEIVESVPYVTEASNVTIVLPLPADDLSHIHAFLRALRSTCRANKAPRTFDRLVAVLYDDKYRTPRVHRAPSVSISELRASMHSLHADCLPGIALELRDERQTSRRTVMHVVDTVVEAKGANALYFVLNVWTHFSLELLNRVRLNTIRSHQVFSAVPFEQYNTRVTAKNAAPINTAPQYGADDELDGAQRGDAAGGDYLKVLDERAPIVDGHIDVHKTQGRFATDDRYFMAFYGVDWLEALVSKGGLKHVLGGGDSSNVLRVFVGEAHLHVLRAPDPHLVVAYHAAVCDPRDGDADVYAQCLAHRRRGVASKAQLAKLILKAN